MSQRTTLPGGARLPIYPLRLFRCDLDQSWSVWFLGKSYFGCFTRYLKGRSHYVPREEWGRVIPGVPLVWKGYCSALVWQRDAKHWLPVCAELTERLELDLRDRYERGQVWEISRAARVKVKEQPPTRGALLETRKDNETPPELDLVPFLTSFYHRPDLDLSVKNPLPALTMVTPTKAAAPGEAASDNGGTASDAERKKMEGLRPKLSSLLNGHV